MRALSLSRFGSLLVKELLETFRDWKMLSLTLTFAPFFVLVMYAYLGHTPTSYQVAVVNQDEGVTGEGADPPQAGRDLMTALESVLSEAGDPVLRLQSAELDASRDLLQDRRADLVLVIPRGFSRALADYRRGASGAPLGIVTRGDPANPDYLMAAVWTDMVILHFVQETAGIEPPVQLLPETVTGTASLGDFDLYVPALLILALMMLMFTAAGALIREKDKGTIVRLRLSNMRVLEWLAAVSVTQIAVGLLALVLTYLTAVAVGYHPTGSVLVVLAVGALASLSVMAFSILVAAFLRTVFDLVTVGCFPFFILMFFSGGMFPLPGVPLFQVGRRTIQINEVLPTTHAVNATTQVLSYGAGLGDLGYELAGMGLLTVAFFAVGTWVFTRRHMPAIG
jgi:ABC-2 type transport system permease protein